MPHKTAKITVFDPVMCQIPEGIPEYCAKGCCNISVTIRFQSSEYLHTDFRRQFKRQKKPK